MNRLALAALVVLLLPAAHAAPGDADGGADAGPPALGLTFKGPAQYDGAADAAFTWIALVLAPDDRVDGLADYPDGGTLENRTVVRTTLQDPLTGSTAVDEREAPTERSPLGTTRITVAGADEWTAVLLTGDLRLTTHGAGRLDWAPAGTSWTTIAGEPDHPVVGRPDARVLPLDGAYLAAGGALTIDGTLGALEWRGLDLACAGDADPCAPTTDVDGPAQTRTHRRIVGDGALSWNGTAHRLIAGTGSLDALLDGTLRLPLARSDGDCPGCLAWHDQTLTLDGTVRVEALSPDGDRLHAAVSGDATAAYLDEAPHDPGRLGVRANIVAGAAAGAVGVGLLAFLALRAAMSPERALRNDSRRTIHEVVGANPGITFRDVLRETGFGNGNAVYHLGVLEASGVVRSRRNRNQLHFYLPTDLDGDSWRRHLALAKPELARLHGLVGSLNAPTQGELVAVTTDWGWSRAVTQKRLRELESVGCLRAMPSGRFRRYVVVDTDAREPGAVPDAPGVPASAPSVSSASTASSAPGTAPARA